MRIAIGQLWQETNTFNPLPTTRRDFEAFGVLRGDELIEQTGRHQRAGRLHPVAAHLARAAGDRRPGAAAGLAQRAGHGARRSTGCATRCSTRSTRRWPVDGVLLALHGAMVADEHPDVEGEVLRRRAAADRPGVPLVATLDLHANVTAADGRGTPTPWCCTTPPRTSTCSRPASARRSVLRRILIDGARPVTAFVKAADGRAGRAGQHAGPGQRQLRLPRSGCRRWSRSRASWPRAWRRCSRGSTSPSWASPCWSSTDGEPDLAARSLPRAGRRAVAAAARLPAGTDAAGRGRAHAPHALPRRAGRPQRRADATTSGAPGDSDVAPRASC